MKKFLLKGLAITILCTTAISLVGCGEKETETDTTEVTSEIVEDDTEAGEANDSEDTTEATDDTAEAGEATADAVFKQVFLELGFDLDNLSMEDLAKLNDGSVTTETATVALQKTAEHFGITEQEVSALYMEGMQNFMQTFQ